LFISRFKTSAITEHSVVWRPSGIIGWRTQGIVKGKGKGKAIPLQAWMGPEGSRSMRLPDYKTSAHEGGKVVSPKHRPPLPPRKYSWYSFL